MHDCRLDGGHFFVHRPQGHAFRCRRCNERFANSWTDPTLKHPWKCLLERCEYVACDPCATFLMEDLALPEEAFEEDEEDTDEEEGEEKRGGNGKAKASSEEPEFIEVPEVDQRQRRSTIEDGRASGPAGAATDGQGLPVMEADEGEGVYEVPTFVCRTARQAAAEAALKRAYVRRSARHGGRVE